MSVYTGVWSRIVGRRYEIRGLELGASGLGCRAWGQRVVGVPSLWVGFRAQGFG